jgi:hypothetical protein
MNKLATEIPAPRLSSAIALGAALTLFVAGAARADEPALDQAPGWVETRHADRLAAFVSAGYLGSASTYGAAIDTGLRLELGTHLAASLDFGYGLVGASVPTMQDRWWLIPSLAVVVPVGGLRIDLGAGLGVGTSSGYAHASDYFDAPFVPRWHYTVPAVRAHAIAAHAVSRKVDVFLRADFASLVATGPLSGHASFGDTTWFGLYLGLQHGVL